MTHGHPEQKPRPEPAPRRASDPLSVCLQDWRRRQDAFCDHDSLAARVALALRTDPSVVPASPGSPHRGRWIERAVWFAAGLAAALAVAWFTSPSRQDDATADWPVSVRFATDQLAGKAALVAGLEETFAGRLAWVAEHDRRVDVGLVPDTVQAGGTPVAVRIVVLSRRAGATAWTTVWQSDVITRDEEVVDVAAGPGGAGRLRLWTHALPDGAIAIDGDLALADAALPLRASYGGVQRPGEPRRVTGARDGGVEWQVIQTVAPLDALRKDVG